MPCNCGDDLVKSLPLCTYKQKGFVWLALSQLVCESVQWRPALFPCFMPGVGILIKHLCFWLVNQIIVRIENNMHACPVGCQREAVQA